MSESVFIASHIAHQDCEWCAVCADRARTTARVTGSVGATHSDGEHSATVRRAGTLPVTDSKTKEYRELAFAISNQAKALAEGDHTGPAYAVVQLIKSNVETLAAWTEDDR